MPHGLRCVRSSARAVAHLRRSPKRATSYENRSTHAESSAVSQSPLSKVKYCIISEIKPPVVSGTRGLPDAERKLATCLSLDYRIASDSENDQLSLGDSIAAPCTTDEDSLLAQDLVGNLPPKYRRVIEGAYFQGQTSREMGPCLAEAR
jgi:hypothetical protein